MTKLTAKQQSFVQEYVVDKNATQAAIRAGYSEKTAQEQSSRLLSNVMVKKAVDELLNKNAERCAVTVESLTDELNEAAAMARAQEDSNALRQAVMAKAKIHGLDVAKVDLSSSDGTMSPKASIDPSKLTTEQLKALKAAQIDPNE